METTRAPGAGGPSGLNFGNRLLVLTGAGAVGGLVGFVISEAYMDDSRMFYSEGEIRTSSGIWFMLIVLGIGAALVGGQALLNKTQPAPESLIITAPSLIVGGFLSGYIAQSLYSAMLDDNEWLARTLGWGLAGLLAGAAASAGFKSVKRLQNGVLGGLAGGLVGGGLFDPIANTMNSAVGSRFVGIMLIGTLMGLLIGLIETARVGMWIDVLNGEFRGRQYVIHDGRARVGSARTLEVPLLGDRSIAEVHCTMTAPPNPSFVCSPGQQVLVNGMPSSGAALNNGDVLRIGNTDVRVNLKAGGPAGAQPAVGVPTAQPSYTPPTSPSPQADRQAPRPPAAGGAPPAQPPRQRPRLPTKDS